MSADLEMLDRIMRAIKAHDRIRPDLKCEHLECIENLLRGALGEKDAEISRLSDYATAAKIQYTDTPPAEPGHYWFKHSKDDAEPGVLLLDADGIGWLHGDDVAWRGGGPVGTLFGPKIVQPK